MGETSPLQDAINAVVNLAKAEQQRAIVKRLRDKIAEIRAMRVKKGRGEDIADGQVYALDAMADELEGELE